MEKVGKVALGAQLPAQQVIYVPEMNVRYGEHYSLDLGYSGQGEECGLRAEPIELAGEVGIETGGKILRS
jgi:hypothetical protein